MGSNARCRSRIAKGSTRWRCRRGTWSSDRNRYMVVTERPIYLLETARPFPAARSARSGSSTAVVSRVARHRPRDRRLQECGRSHLHRRRSLLNQPARSMELAKELQRLGSRRSGSSFRRARTWSRATRRCSRSGARWSTASTSLRHGSGDGSPPEELRQGDSNTDHGEGQEIARELKCGITGNFMVDPVGTSRTFTTSGRSWRSTRCSAAYTILTPLPGTQDWAKWKDTAAGQPWYKWDMHHALPAPAFGVERFFELFMPRPGGSVLNMGDGEGKGGALEVGEADQDVADPAPSRIAMQTQRLVSPKVYLKKS